MSEVKAPEHVTRADGTDRLIHITAPVGPGVTFQGVAGGKSEGDHVDITVHVTGQGQQIWSLALGEFDTLIQRLHGLSEALHQDLEAST